ncbi:GH3 auxin-responsive promoter [Candidatus Moduliflexus flocculans]|uniref:GH3 auxin-responsive promoter n=1 Tax=Candidatus Moduliflexus flocculans TaxID=1499966 RepID=A0A0S6W4C7_9BACT|nr:GH3 auxin-responsive promoter [Candidatus Moduliflexus flocculans]
MQFLLQALFALSHYPESRRFLSRCEQVRSAQFDLMQAAVRQNEATVFGKEHGFHDICDLATYRKHVPIRTYQDFLPYIRQIQAGNAQVLTAEPVLLLHPTGGTTGTKLIPYTAALKREFQRALAPWIVNMASHFPDILHGQTYWTITPPRKQSAEREQAIAEDFEEDSAYFGWKGLLLGQLFAVPSWVTQMTRMENFRFLTLYFLLCADNLRWLSIWSPTFLLVLLEELDRHAERLLASLRDGWPDLPEPETFPIRLKRRPNRARSIALEQALRLPPSERYQAIWPRLSLISLWKDGASAFPARQLQALFPKTYFQGKGLLATEGVISIPLQGIVSSGETACVPAFTSHLLEFVSEQNDEARWLWELEEGQTYSVILTTGGGLYRYDIGDLVRVEGFWRGLPMLRFIGRKGRHSDLVGEKLEECFVNTAIEQALQRCSLRWKFLLIAPEISEQRRGYVAFVESEEDESRLSEFIHMAEGELCGNFQYDVARRLKQLEPLRLVRVARNGAQTYLQRGLDAGQKLGDIKPALFDSRSCWQDFFELDNNNMR